MEELRVALGGGLGAQAPRAGAAPGRLGPETDARVLPVAMDGSGQQYREFREAVQLCEQMVITAFVVKGPRTALWVLKFIVENGGTPLGRFSRFRIDAGVSMTDPGVAQLESLYKLLQVAMTVDQLDGSNLAVIELICREIQMIEGKYSDRLTARAGALSQESHLFLGTTMAQGNVCMCPALREHIASELRDEASILKERRKAREERQQQRPPPGEKGNNNNKKKNKDGKEGDG